MTRFELNQLIKGGEELGSGTSGTAYKVKWKGQECLLKITSSKNEIHYQTVVMRLQKTNPEIEEYTAKIYEIFTVGGEFGYIAELLEVTDEISEELKYTTYKPVYKLCELLNLRLSELIDKGYKELMDYFKVIDFKPNEYFWTILKILRLNKFIGANDYHYKNLGFSKEGKLKAYDFDRKDGRVGW